MKCPVVSGSVDWKRGTVIDFPCLIALPDSQKASADTQVDPVLPNHMEFW